MPIVETRRQIMDAFVVAAIRAGHRRFAHIESHVMRAMREDGRAVGHNFDREIDRTLQRLRKRGEIFFGNVPGGVNGWRLES